MAATKIKFVSIYWKGNHKTDAAALKVNEVNLREVLNEVMACRCSQEHSNRNRNIKNIKFSGNLIFRIPVELCKEIHILSQELGPSECTQYTVLAKLSKKLHLLTHELIAEQTPRQKDICRHLFSRSMYERFIKIIVTCDRK